MSAGEAGRLLTAFDRAFRSYVRGQTGRTGIGLEVREIGVGSFWVKLGAAAGAYHILSSVPDIIPMFANNIDYVLGFLMEHDFDDTPKYIRDLLRSLGEAGKRLHADSIDIISTIKVSLDATAFDMVTRPDRSRRNKREVAESPIALPDQSVRAYLTNAAALAVKEELVAKLFNVEETWYARPEDMHGVMLPIKLSKYCEALAESGRQFRIRGTIEKSDEGYPIAIIVDRLTPTKPPGELRLPPPSS